MIAVDASRPAVATVFLPVGPVPLAHLATNAAVTAKASRTTSAAATAIRDRHGPAPLPDVLPDQ